MEAHKALYILITAFNLVLLVRLYFLLINTDFYCINYEPTI